MPYHKSREVEGCVGKVAVVKDSDGQLMGCHDTEEEADQQLAAIHANEDEAAAARTWCSPGSGRAGCSPPAGSS